MANSSNWKTDTENTFTANTCLTSHKKCIIAKFAHVGFFWKGDFNSMYAKVALKSEQGLCILVLFS